MFGCAYQRIADQTCSARTLRRRRQEWIAAGVYDLLLQLAVATDDRLLGLDLEHLAVDGCITKAPYGGQAAGPSQVDRGKRAPSAPWPWRRATSRWACSLPLPTGVMTAS